MLKTARGRQKRSPRIKGRHHVLLRGLFEDLRRREEEAVHLPHPSGVRLQSTGCTLTATSTARWLRMLSTWGLQPARRFRRLRDGDG